MAITKSDVQRVAALARIALTHDEEERFVADLSSVLAFVAELEKADTTGVDAMTGGTDLSNIMRADASSDTSLEGSAADLIDALPDRRDGWAKVKSVF